MAFANHLRENVTPGGVAVRLRALPRQLGLDGR